MRKTRLDEWTGRDDEKLAEIVLKHIREGSTQLKAFDEAGDILERTANAVGFRWNSTVRHSYINAFNHAMKQRRELKKNKQPLSTTGIKPLKIVGKVEESRSNQTEELLHALDDVYKHTENIQVKYIIGQAIEFIKKSDASTSDQ